MTGPKLSHRKAISNTNQSHAVSPDKIPTPILYRDPTPPTPPPHFRVERLRSKKHLVEIEWVFQESIIVDSLTSSVWK